MQTTNLQRSAIRWYICWIEINISSICRIIAYRCWKSDYTDIGIFFNKTSNKNFTINFLHEIDFKSIKCKQFVGLFVRSFFTFFLSFFVWCFIIFDCAIFHVRWSAQLAHANTHKLNFVWYKIELKFKSQTKEIYARCRLLSIQFVSIYNHPQWILSTQRVCICVLCSTIEDISIFFDAEECINYCDCVSGFWCYCSLSLYDINCLVEMLNGRWMAQKDDEEKKMVWNRWQRRR